MKISVIIPVYNDWENLNKCLNSLINQSCPEEQYEIIVVNNHTSNEIPEWIQRSEQVRFIHQPQPGSYVARNTGIDSSKGELLAFTDSDCLPDRDWLKNADQVFCKNHCDLIGGKVEIFKPDDASNLAYIYEKHTAFQQHHHVPAGNSVTANLFVKKNILEQTGSFDNEIKSGGDWEFTKRCVSNGFRIIYADNVKVLHPARKSIYQILRKQYRFACWGTINIQREFGHSKMRILLSHMLGGIRNLFRYRPYTNNIKQELPILFVINMIFFFKTIVFILILLRIVNPDKAR